MLNPKPSSLPYEERKEYVLKKIKEFCEEWNYLPPKEYDKEKILALLDKRDNYLGVKLEHKWVESPSSLWSSLRSSLWSSRRSLLDSSLNSSLGSLLWSSLDSSLRSSLNSSLNLSLRSSLNLSRWSSLDLSLRSSLNSSLWLSLRSSRWSSLNLSRWSSLDSSFWSSYGFLNRNILYEFNENPEIKNFVKYLPEAYKSGLGFALITNKEFYALPMPDYYLNERNQLHRDMAPAVIWADRTPEYWLNGVKCPKKIVMTDWKKIDARKIVKEPNAEVRREIVRKIGIEKVCYELGAKVIDKQEDYELLHLNIGDGRERPYLKMINPSTRTYHIEGVPVDIRTVDEALTWRNQTFIRPIIIT